MSAITIPAKITKAIPTKGIQRGEVTHHQDQSIDPVSLRTIKIRNSTTLRLLPVDLF